MKPKNQRLIFVAVSVAFLCIAALFTLNAFRDNMVYFYAPKDLISRAADDSKLLRVGGLVKEGSIVFHGRDRVNFTLTDYKADIDVHYQGVLPGLFREKQGVVAEGYLVAPGIFQATTVLTKHDENYMPKDVVDALRKSGRWREGEQ